ncbi:MAG: cytochrome c [Planctomycetes bacterium]|nr:cytochrome c [Planctomycetota bacterium]
MAALRALLAPILLGALAGAQTPPEAARLERGVLATFERVGEATERATLRLRLLSFAVERGETPSPWIEPGLFRATLRTTVELPLRDRLRFRIEGRGSAKLVCNGEPVLDGRLRPGKPLESAEPVRLKKGPNELLVTFESNAPGDGELRVSWAGGDFGFEPIAPERLHIPAEADIAAAELLRAGHRLFAERHCARCHEPETRRIGESAFGELDTQGPDLRTVGARASAGWMAAWLRDPRAMRPDATMPRIRFANEHDADDVAAYLATLGAPLAAPPFPGGFAGSGEIRFRQLGCVACHTAPGAAPADAALGDRIPLGHVAAKWHPAALVSFLQDPLRDHPSSRMPDFNLSRDDAMQLAAFLSSAPAVQIPASRGNAEHGRKLVERHDCVQCHAIDVPITERRPAKLRNLRADRGCLQDGGGDSGLDHGFAPEQVAALRAFLPFAEQVPFRSSPLDYVAQNVAARRCTACHALDGAPSTWARVVERVAVAGPVPVDQDPTAQGVPALTWVGAKLQPTWIARFVGGDQPSPRPWLHARMPKFRSHAQALAQGLVREHGYPAADEVQPAPDLQSAMHGERLVQMGKGLGCVQCHALGDAPAVQVFERAGIELGTARSRLRHEYFTRWLRDPTRLDPDSRMPRYAPSGTTAITDVLGGDGAQQFEAIWQFLGTKVPARR